MLVLEFLSIYCTARLMNLTYSGSRHNLGGHSDASNQQNFGKKKKLWILDWRVSILGTSDPLSWLNQ